MPINIILALVGAYLFGSVPWGFLAGKIRGVDLRKVGSGNIGATNALRILGKPIGITVFLLDFFKGFLPVAVTFALGFPEWVPVLAGVLTILGHNFPVWLGFRGGKGIATTAGVLLALFPWWVFAAGLVAWVGLFFTTRFVSVASLASAVAISGSCIAGVIFDQIPLAAGLAGVVFGILAFLRHIPNIRRLCAGTEPRFEKKPKSVEASPTA